jgi:hypothetical protein
MEHQIKTLSTLRKPFSKEVMVVSFDLNSTFGSLFGVTILAALLTGSTLQWVVNRGFFKTQYNIIVTVAALTSLIQTVTCFVNALMAPNHNLSFMIYIIVNWVFMTHSSAMLVSRKLSLTYHNSEQAWRRLLLINVMMFPISIFTCVYWSTTHKFDSEVFKTINKIMEPVQIALWGLIEFCLSGAFIVQMWKFHWTSVERQGIFVLLLVGVCDSMSVLLNLFIGDLESTCVKGFVYCLRIRLEVSVLCSMVEFVKSKRGSVRVSGVKNAWSLSRRRSTTEVCHETSQGLEDSSWLGASMPFSRRISKRNDVVSGDGAGTTSKQRENIRSERIASTDTREEDEQLEHLNMVDKGSHVIFASPDQNHQHLHGNKVADEDLGTVEVFSNHSGPQQQAPTNSGVMLLGAIKEETKNKDHLKRCDVENVATLEASYSSSSRWDEEDDESNLPVAPFKSSLPVKTCK